MLVHTLPHCYGGFASLGPCRVYSSVRTILVQESQIPTGKAPASAAAVEQSEEQAAITSAVWLEAGMAAAETPAAAAKAAGGEAASGVTAPRSSKSGSKKKSKTDLPAGPSDATAAAGDSEAAPVGATAGQDGKKKSRKSKADQVTVASLVATLCLVIGRPVACSTHTVGTEPCCPSANAWSQAYSDTLYWCLTRPLSTVYHCCLANTVQATLLVSLTTQHRLQTFCLKLPLWTGFLDMSDANCKQTNQCAFSARILCPSLGKLS